MKFILCLWVLAFPGLFPGNDTPSAPALLEQFFKKGIAIPGVPPVKLSEPLLKEGMTPAVMEAALEKAAGRNPIDLFLKNSPYSPFNLTIEPVEDDKGVHHGYYLKLAFVAHGKMSTVVDHNMLAHLIGGARGNVQNLSGADLTRRGISGLAAPEIYGIFSIDVLETVILSGVTRNIKSTHDKSAYMLAVLDDRFAKDNAWRPIDAEGKQGKPRAYSGLGGYVYAMELPQLAGALYLEMHYVFHEPPEWFGGRNLLRAKLPIIVRDNVHDFRRRLTKMD